MVYSERGTLTDCVDSKEVCEFQSLKHMLNSLCRDDSYAMAQWVEHPWPEAKVLSSIPSGDSHCSSDLSRLHLSLKQMGIYCA